MANVFDYLTWRGDLSFAQSPFNPVDNIIFSQLSYLPLDHIMPGPDKKNGISIDLLAKNFAESLSHETSHLHPELMFKDAPAFVSALGSSKRFKNCELWAYVNHVDISQEKQFSALSIIIGDGSSFIVYRGTDANIVGWKENFNMGFSEAVPAQLEAVSYLEKAAKIIKGPLRIGGHSKGGNLAVYAAAFCNKKIRRRISEIYSNDAPGFHHQVIESEGFQSIKERIYSFVPQSSIVGMLLEHGSPYTVIKSSQSGLMQHDLYSWEVTHNDMVRLDRVTQGSRFVDKTLREWISSLDYDHRQQFIEALYTILSASQAKSIPELTGDWFNAAGRMIQSLGNIDEHTRTLIGKTLAALFRAARNNIDTLFKPENK
ncbi:hypothetical protein AGMMS50293_00390 [Spirochaetia bacterium]|nr:hypothetical protein AGMMS50293_00390 [Spirochaetia bacterium]